MKRKLISLLLAVLLATGIMPSAFAGYENFTAQAVYTSGQFTDVAEDAWYAENVRAAYEYGLINGQSATRFAPDSNLTVAEAIKLAACLHSIYHTGSTEFAASSPWYQTYVTYALQNGILSAARTDYTNAATRAVFAEVLAAALPADALTPINTVEDGAIPDVSLSASYADAVYLLYRAGVLTGSNGAGSFLPNSTIKRSEAAAIVTRMADPTLRRTVTLTVPEAMGENQIYDACMPAVIKLYAYNSSGEAVGVGSGVLISANGDVVTCGHLVNGAYRLVAELTTGEQYEVEGIYDMDTTVDIARIRLSGSNFPYLRIGGSVSAGDAVYTLGYPGGGSATIKAGTVKNASYQDASGVTLIESTAMVVSGNSGGALVDETGSLVGVVISSQTGGTPSYAVPIAQLNSLSTSTLLSEDAFTASRKPAITDCYTALYPVTDFGKLFGVRLHEFSRMGASSYFYYRVSDLPVSAEEALQTYYNALKKNTFYHFSGSSLTSSAGYPYAIEVYMTTNQGKSVICIAVARLTSVPVGGLIQTASFFVKS